MSSKFGYLELADWLARLRRNCDDDSDVLHGWPVMCDDGTAMCAQVVLEKLGFPRPRQYQRVSSLSGGERRRLHLASVLVAAPNVLILDGACVFMSLYALGSHRAAVLQGSCRGLDC